MSCKLSFPYYYIKEEEEEEKGKKAGVISIKFELVQGDLDCNKNERMNGKRWKR